MKKIFSILILIGLFLLVFHGSVLGATPIGVKLNGNMIIFNENSGYPFIDNNSRTLVPLRKTMEEAGYSVSWETESQLACVSDNQGTTVFIKIGDNYITKEMFNNGVVESSRIKNDTFAQIVGGRTFLPMRVVLEAFGANVSWDNSINSVVVDTGENNAAQSTVPAINENSKETVSDKYTAETVYEKYSSAVFLILTYDNTGALLSSGSGFFIDSNGTAITNYHVLENSYSANIMTTDGNTYEIEGVYDYHKSLDVAKIKINGSGFNTVATDFSGNVKGGSVAYAIGSPLGFDNTISEGIISNPNRILDDITYYQITVPISHGSSGGALFNQSGKVIGITTAGFTLMPSDWKKEYNSFLNSQAQKK